MKKIYRIFLYLFFIGQIYFIIDMYKNFYTKKKALEALKIEYSQEISMLKKNISEKEALLSSIPDEKALVFEAEKRFGLIPHNAKKVVFIKKERSQVKEH